MFQLLDNAVAITIFLARVIKCHFYSTLVLSNVGVIRGSQIPATHFDFPPMISTSDTRRGPIPILHHDRSVSIAARLSPFAPFPRWRTSGPIASHRVEVAPPIGARHYRCL